MKSAALASLLVTSAAAGAAAAGGPFFFATTCPMSITIGETVPGIGVPPLGTNLTRGKLQVVTEDFVVTNICVSQSGSDYGVSVDGVLVWRGAAIDDTSVASFADGAGISVPAGSTLGVHSNQGGRIITLTGYHF